MTYNVWNKWDKLETIMVGSCHPLEFYDKIKEDKIRDPLLRITEETLKELDYFKSVLKDFGCEVIQAPTEYEKIDDWAEQKELPRSSLQPRDCQLVLGNKLLVMALDNRGILQSLKDYNNEDIIFLDQTNLFSDHFNTTKYVDKLGKIRDAPCVTGVGDRVYIDMLGKTSNAKKLIKDQMPEFEIVDLKIGGHNDACFATLKQGVLLSLYDIQNYKETFPGWDVCYLQDQSWDKISEWQTIKAKTKGKWWVPGEEHNDELINFVNTWLTDWVGYVEETVFDVNVLTLDEHHVCVSNPNNEQVNSFLKKHNMEPIYIPWRHRYFWDGGLHCITLDLKRQGKKENYF